MTLLEILLATFIKALILKGQSWYSDNLGFYSIALQVFGLRNGWCLF